MKSYEVVETLRKSKKAVFTPKDIAKITGLNGNGVYVLISRLYKRVVLFFQTYERRYISFSGPFHLVKSRGFLHPLYIHEKP
ncbi:hypothetical protein CW713_10300 [Methanophagales archaeon]|nr:MAG: hypothetical protein CW713_10300 [Methanophagales archaeon]